MLKFFIKLLAMLPRCCQPRKILMLSKRADEWREVRAEHLKKQPACAACGRTKNLAVHHVIPVSFAPELELEPKNLLTLCDTPCHIVFGHFFNYHCYNKDVRKMTAEFARAMRDRKCLQRFRDPS